MKTIKLGVIFLLVLPILAFAQVDTPSAGLTPDSPFYFFDRISEAIERVFTFNPEAKAKLEISFAGERISEIKIILETEGVDAKGFDRAESILLDNLSRAANIINKEKGKGKDISALAKELTDDFDAHKSILQNAFKSEKESLEAKIDELKVKIKEAVKAGDSALVELFNLKGLRIQKELFSDKLKYHEEEIEEYEDLIEEEMNAKEEALKKIAEAEKKMSEIVNENMKKGINVPVDIVAKFNTAISKAKVAYDAGNYDEAKNLAKDAKKIAAIGHELAEKMKEERESDEDEDILGDDASKAREHQLETDKKLIELRIEGKKESMEEAKHEDEKAMEELKKQMEQTMEELKQKQEGSYR